jgi:hypothetical protein
LSLAATTTTAGALEWSLAPRSSAYDAREYLGDRQFLLNREQGRLVGATVAVSGQPDDGVKATLQAERLSGLVAYQGLSQVGLPIATHTRLGLQRIELGLGPATGWAIGPGRLQGHAALAMQRLDRRIRASSLSLPLREILSSQEVVFGAAFEVPTMAAALPLGLVARLSASMPFDQTLVVDSHGQFDRARLAPAPRTTWAAGLEAVWRPAVGWRAGLGVSTRWLRVGPAPAQGLTREGLPVGTISYPGSRQTIRSILVHVGMMI